MVNLAELYQSVIIEHDRRPRNCRELDHPSATASARNPLCGDQVSVSIRVDADGCVSEIAFQGEGCAISRAAASLMTVAVTGKTVAEARELFAQFHALVTGKPADAALLGKLGVFAGVSAFPMRVKCATLAWHTLKAALDQQSSNFNSSTEMMPDALP